jgi:hypothetical protein
MTQADPESVIQTLLTNNWTSGNTDNRTPKFYISSEPSVSKFLSHENLGDIILIYERNRQNIKNSTGSSSKRAIYHVSLDCRSTVSRAHFIKFIGEAERVLDANIVNPATGYNILDPTGTIPISNDSTKGFWRGVIECALIKSNVTRNA